MTAAPKPVRPQLLEEVYRLDHCGPIEIPTRAVVNCRAIAPCCGETLRIEWRRPGGGDQCKALRAALQHPKSQGLSNSAIAKHVGVDEGTVRSWREKMSASSEIPKMDSRTVTRGAQTYQQNTAGCKLSDGTAAPGKSTCSKCAPTFRAWLRGKTRLRARANSQRAARQAERNRPAWSLV